MGAGRLFRTATRVGRVAVAGTLIVAFGACSLADPFVTRDRVKRPATAGPVSLPAAIEYGDEVKNAYREALRDQALLQTWLAIGLIPLTAAAMGLGARAASPDAVLALGLTGASALGLGTWLHNKPRQLAWAAGLKAVTCVQKVVAPLRGTDTPRSRQSDRRAER